MTFDLGMLLGLLGIAIAIFFGIYSFNNNIRNKLEDILRSLVKIDTRLEDFVQFRDFSKSGTVEVELENFGKTKITAEPGLEDTSYIIEVTKGVLKASLINKLSKITGFEDKEKSLFSKGIPKTMSLSPKAMRFRLLTTDPNLCVQYINLLLRWLDSEYTKGYKAEINTFENGIKG